MKLYATVTSERAKKGQGGNKFLDIDVYGEEGIQIYRLEVKENGDGIPCIECFDIQDLEKAKGERQKGGHVIDCGCIHCNGGILNPKYT